MRIVSAAVLLLALATGCSAGDAATSGSTQGPLDVVVAAYPLQYLAAEVGGDRVRLHNVATDGVEAHDLELTPRDVGTVRQADLVVTLPGFQPALDDAVRTGGLQTYDVGSAVELLQGPRTEEDSGEGHGHEEEEPSGDVHGEGEASASAAADPHFWLDPLRMAKAADGLAARLTAADPAGEPVYAANAARLRERLEALDADFARTLTGCRSSDLVTAHDAFGYLASRYGLRQRPIAGIRPDIEPSPAALAEVTKYVRENDVTTVYAEVLTDARIARTVTEETGARLAVLDPLEGLPQGAGTSDYIELMRRNLDVLREGQGCA